MIKLINIHEMLVEISEDIHDKYRYLGANHLEADDMADLLSNEPDCIKGINVLKCKYFDTSYSKNTLTYRIKYTLKDTK